MIQTTRGEIRKAIAFCCDATYLPFALFAAQQIAILHPNRNFDICICDEQEPLIPTTLAGLGLRPVGLQAGDTFAGFGIDRRRTESAYHRILLPHRLADYYDRILYLDADIFVQGGDYSRLLETPFDSHPIAAVLDNPQWRTPARKPVEFKAEGLPNALYFNSGVLLIDVRQWLSQQVTERALAYGIKRRGMLPRHDQTLLNVILHNDWAELSPVWNWQYSRSARLHEGVVGAHIVHFIGNEKPWNAPPSALPSRFSTAVALFCEAHFPDQKVFLEGRRLDLASAPMMKMLIRHLLNAHKMSRYLARFPCDYQAICSGQRL